MRNLGAYGEVQVEYNVLMSLDLMRRTYAALIGCLLTVTAAWAAAADSPVTASFAPSTDKMKSMSSAANFTRQFG